jgi:peptide/nickel transport system substrate-binding protein
MAFFSALTKRRRIPVLEHIEKDGFLSPSDWAVVAILGFVMGLSALTLLAGVSIGLTTEVPARGGSYTEGVIGSPRFANPLLAVSETDRDLTKLVYSGLLKANPDTTLSEDLAESYTVSEDGRTYTFTLKEDARFHDGNPVTADDVAFTVRSAQNPSIKSPRRVDWEGVAVEVIDSRTIAFTLNAPYAPFLENATMGILPKVLWEKINTEEFSFTTLNTKPVGSGPFEVESIHQNSSGIPTEYRLKAFAGGVRVPYIDRFTVKFYPNEEELQAAFNRREIEAASSINPKVVSAPHEVYEAVFGRVFGIFFNQSQNTLFASETVRRALDAALDKELIISTVLSGYGSVIDGPLPPEHTDTEAESAATHEEKLAAARSLLTEAGWEAGEDGVLELTSTSKGKESVTRLSFSLSTSNTPELKQAAEIAAESWRTLGSEVSLKFFEQNDLSIEVIRPRRYDALLFGEVVGRKPDLFAFWHSSQRNDPGLNIALYANTDTDRNLEIARSDADPVEQRTRLLLAAEEIKSEVAAIFLYAPHFVYLASPRISGVTLGSVAVPADRFDSVDDWYLSSERIWPIFNSPFETTLKNLFNF